MKVKNEHKEEISNLNEEDFNDFVDDLDKILFLETEEKEDILLQGNQHEVIFRIKIIEKFRGSKDLNKLLEHMPLKNNNLKNAKRNLRSFKTGLAKNIIIYNA